MASAITERWRLNFTTTTAFQVIGENSGVIATGVTGDHVEVDADHTVINGVTVSNGLALSEKLGKTPSDYTRQVNIPGNAIWVTGSHPRSFDSRYWGFVYERQIIGKAYALPF